MKVLVVGGSGLIGGDAALHLQAQGHDVTVMARKPPVAPALARLPFLQGDYIADDFSSGQLDGFDGLVFSAAADVRNLPQDRSETPEAFYRRANDEAVPRFVEAARAAGVSRVVYIGSFYAEVAPQRIGVCPYVTSRFNTDVAVRALSSDGFNVCSLNAPFVLGRLPGLPVPYIDALVAYARGQLEGVPVFAPRGGTNHMTSGSLAEAVLGALERGESGKPYLVGDENYTWKAYLELWFRAAGNPREIAVSDDDHPLFPNAIMFAGPGALVSYEPPAAEVELLGYSRGRVAPLIAELAAAPGA
jgi:nucleoside-diphosphate-sugar epimerase